MNTMDNLNFEDIEVNLKNYISNLETEDFNFKPSNTGSTTNGRKLQLGFLCYALKTMYILNDSRLENEEYVGEFVNKNNFFQIKEKNKFQAYYVDENYKKAFQKIYLKNLLKTQLNFSC